MVSLGSNIVHQLSSREYGNNKASNKILELAEYKAATSVMHEMHCKFPQSTRSTFLMSFSPDCKKVASTHGDHKVYVSDIKTGGILHKLEGHPRTPWCVAFHPTSNEILASGCLGGEVRIWHLHGGCEKWRASNGQVIASLTFHPFLQLIVIATGNTIYFWDWKDPKPYAWCSTSSQYERVRFVKFDSIGHFLITGISNNTPTKIKAPKSSSLENNISCDMEDETVLTRAHVSRLVSADDPEDLSESLRNSVNDWIRYRPRRDNRTDFSSGPSGTSLYNQFRTSGEFCVTFLRLRSICAALEKRLLFHQHLQSSTESDAGLQFSSGSESQLSDFEDFSRFMAGSDNLTVDHVNRNYYASLISMLARIRTSLRFSSLPAGTSREPTTRKMDDILYRQRNILELIDTLNNLKERIFAAVTCVQQTGYAGTDRQRFDLRFCLWLVEMSFELVHEIEGVVNSDFNILNGKVSSSSAEQPSTEDEDDTEMSVFDRLNIDVADELITSGATTINANSLSFGDSGVQRSSYSAHRFTIQISIRRNLSQQFAALSARRYESLGRRMRIPNELLSGNAQESNDDSVQPPSPPSPPRRSTRLSRPVLWNEMPLRRSVSPPARSGNSEQRDPTTMFLHLINDTFLEDPGNRTSGSQNSAEQPLPFVSIFEDRSNESNRPISPFHMPSSSFMPLMNDPGQAGDSESLNQTHRIQSWKFTGCGIPEIYNGAANVVVRRCLIHNDASVDISQDGEKLVALIPPDDTSFNPFIFGVFSLKPNELGQVLCTWGFVSTAISVNFSPLANYIVVGLASSRPIFTNPEREAVAHIVKIIPPEMDKNSSAKEKIQTADNNKFKVKHIRVLTQQITNDRNIHQASLNSIRWLPEPGQGIAYATNRGCLSICRPKAPMFLKKYKAYTEGSIIDSTGISLGLSDSDTDESSDD